MHIILFLQGFKVGAKCEGSLPTLLFSEGFGIHVTMAPKVDLIHVILFLLRFKVNLYRQERSLSQFC